MPWRVNKYDGPLVQIHPIGPDVLGDASGLFIDQAGLSDGIE